MSLVELESVGHLTRLLKEQKLLVLHFCTSWSDPCKDINDGLLDLAKEFGQCLFVKVDAEVLVEVTLKYDVIAVPTVLFLKNDCIVDRVDGAYLADVFRKIRHLTKEDVFAPPLMLTLKENESLEQQLKILINSSGCVLFMKGCPKQPRCGFSREAVSILEEYNSEYSYFDILQNEEVRQGLKRYSNWPTYPQLYLNGNLIGGVDIIKELKENGELEKMLPKKQKASDKKLKSLITRSPIMLFMKGTPLHPMCGFSHAMCNILKDNGVEKYDTFDVLQDNEVRDGLKEYSNWPTYPQLYVNGTLIGGVDIIKELNDSNTLLSTLFPTD